MNEATIQTMAGDLYNALRNCTAIPPLT